MRRIDALLVASRFDALDDRTDAAGKKSTSIFPWVGPPPSHKGALTIGAIMRPARASLLLSTAIVALAVAGCETLRKPLRGVDKQPPGSIILDSDPGGTVMIWPVFDLPQSEQTFRPRLDGQDVVYMASPQNADPYYQYYEWMLQGWTGGWT